MHFKAGDGWRACYDEKRNLFTAGVWGFGLSLYEINEVIFDALEDGMGSAATSLITKGRKLYADINDRCGPPYTIVFDKNYQKLCPWAEVTASGPEWPAALTDAAVEMTSSKANNHEQKRKEKGRSGHKSDKHKE